MGVSVIAGKVLGTTTELPVSKGGWDGFAMKIDGGPKSTHGVLWKASWGTPGFDYVFGLATTAFGGAVITGVFGEGTLAFDPTNVIMNDGTTGKQNGYVFEVSP